MDESQSVPFSTALSLPCLFSLRKKKRERIIILLYRWAHIEIHYKMFFRDPTLFPLQY